MNRMIIGVIGNYHYMYSNLEYCALSKVFLDNFYASNISKTYDDYDLMMVYDNEVVHRWDGLKDIDELHEAAAKCKEIIRTELVAKRWKK